jgi:hypothetical protein
MIFSMSYEEAWDFVFHGFKPRDLALWAQQTGVSVGECVAKFWDEAIQDACSPGEDLDFADMAVDARVDHEDRMVKEAERELNWATAQAQEAVEKALRSQPDKALKARSMLNECLSKYGLDTNANDRLYIWQLYQSLRQHAHII